MGKTINLINDEDQNMKELRVSLRAKLNFYPPVIGYLASIDEGSYSYNYYGLRHPGGIFSLQFGNILDDFLDLLRNLKELQNKPNEVGEIRLERRLECLLYSFFKYYESCYEIILGCCEKHESPGGFIYKWLKKNGYSVGEFLYEKTKDDTSYFRDIFNRLKHTSNTLRILYFHRSDIKVFGYYLESANTNGSLGPDENLHAIYQNAGSANSFNFDLRRLYYCVYEVAEALRSALILHFKETYSIDLAFNNNWEINNSKAKDLYDKIINLPYIFFPNEFGKRLPLPFLEEINKNRYLVFKIRNAKTTDLSGFKINSTTSGDGFSRSFRFPFFVPPKSRR